MAGHTPVIGLTAIVKSRAVEWRVLGCEWGMRELVKDVANGPKLSGVTSGTRCLVSWRRSGLFGELCSCLCPRQGRRQVKVPTASLAPPPRSHSRRIASDTYPARSRCLALPLFLPTRRVARHTPSRSLQVATTSSLCPESSSHPAPAVWAPSQA